MSLHSSGLPNIYEKLNMTILVDFLPGNNALNTNDFITIVRNRIRGFSRTSGLMCCGARQVRVDTCFTAFFRAKSMYKISNLWCLCLFRLPWNKALNTEHIIFFSTSGTYKTDSSCKEEKCSTTSKLHDFLIQ